MTLKLRTGWRSDRSGASAVEFALVAPVFLACLLGIVEFGRAMWIHNALQQAAVAGARCEGIAQGSVGSTAACGGASVTSYVQTVASGWGITVPTSGISSTTSTTCGGASGFSSVTITYTFSTVAPQIVPALASMPMSATACFPNQP
ncbi:MAG TPA: TadE family protein [Caulobacteraceae bacterium]|nr:TadE family protein [Caulobacteraceae bacterium]